MVHSGNCSGDVCATGVAFLFRRRNRDDFLHTKLVAAKTIYLQRGVFPCPALLNGFPIRSANEV